MVVLKTLVQLSQILYREVNFSRNDIRNFHINQVRADEYRHDVCEKRFQPQLSLNVGVGVADDKLMGPIFLQKKFTVAT